MRRIVVTVMVAGVIALSACSNKTEQKDATISNATESEVIRTEGELQSLLESIKPGEVRKNVVFVGVLDVGVVSSLIGAPSSRLIVGNTRVFVRLDQLGKDKYSRQASEYDRKTVSMKADIKKPDPTKDPAFAEPLIVNVQHIEKVDQP